MESATAEILNKYGFHVRPSTSFSQLAQTFDAQITVCVGDMEVDAKSVMSLMTLGATQGTKVEIRADGPDAAAAVTKLKALVNDRFGGIE